MIELETRCFNIVQSIIFIIIIVFRREETKLEMILGAWNSDKNLGSPIIKFI